MATPIYRSHAPRGNASCNAPALRDMTLEHHGRHSHARAWECWTGLAIPSVEIGHDKLAA
ncbi:MAG: hypothetical protein Q8N96_06185 [Methylovulum sp.]|nr:hypothetical protein [Methylovulum sp.]